MVMQRMTKKMGLTGDEWLRKWLDGGQQPGRCLSFLDSEATEEEEEA